MRQRKHDEHRREHTGYPDQNARPPYIDAFSRCRVAAVS